MMTDTPAPVALALLREFSHEPMTDAVDIAEDFHEASKIYPACAARAMGPAGQFIANEPQASFALGRKALLHAGTPVLLAPPPALPVDLTHVVRSRRSSLPDAPAAVDLDQLGALLGLCAGQHPERPGFRVVPSGGAMYPLDLALIAHQVTGLPSGAYVYDPIAHGLFPLGPLDPPAFHAAASASLLAPPQPALTLAIVATFARTRAKYGLRGYRFCLLEAGHIAQAALLAASALGLAALPWGGFIDAAVDDLLELDGRERSCVYLVAISSAPEAADAG
jgi:SagB-type dehydrogenase family enzyme